MDSALTTVWDWSIDDQTVGGLDPYEIMGGGSTAQREDRGRPLVGRHQGPAAGHLPGTADPRHRAGRSFGHNGGENTITVAAVNVSTAGGGAFTGGAANPVETYSSDGPRRIFYNPYGTAITPGNVLFGTGGGRDLQKPDVTAADCVTTTTPGFTSFCGTSAAAPHAAAIAALLKSAPNNPSTGQALSAMFATALDVNPTGRDQNAGVGIVMANLAAGALTNVPVVDFYTVTPCRVVDTRLAGGPTSGAPLTCGLAR